MTRPGPICSSEPCPSPADCAAWLTTRASSTPRAVPATCRPNSTRPRPPVLELASSRGPRRAPPAAKPSASPSPREVPHPSAPAQLLPEQLLAHRLAIAARDQPRWRNPAGLSSAYCEQPRPVSLARHTPTAFDCTDASPAGSRRPDAPPFALWPLPGRFMYPKSLSELTSAPFQLDCHAWAHGSTGDWKPGGAAIDARSRHLI